MNKNMSKTVNGVVKWFKYHLGYGFVCDDEENEYFFHYTGIKHGTKERKLKPNVPVRFNLGENDRGTIAVNVEIRRDTETTR